MGRRKKNQHDGLIGLFDIGPQEATLQRILDRAVDARVRKAEQLSRARNSYTFRKTPSRKATESDLLFAFKKALKRFPPPPRPLCDMPRPIQAENRSISQSARFPCRPKSNPQKAAAPTIEPVLIINILNVSRRSRNLKRIRWPLAPSRLRH